MNPGGLPRPVLLAAVALLAGLVAVATERTIDPRAPQPRPLLGESSRWQQATAAVLGSDIIPAGCGYAVGAETLAVTHPALPCGIRIVIERDGVQAEVQVAGRAGQGATPAPFGLTRRLAAELGISGPAVIRWTLSAR